MVFDVLVAAEGVLFRPRRRAAGNEVRRLIVAKTRKRGILAGEIVIEADVPSSFVELSHRCIDVVEACRCRIRRGIKLNHLRPDGIDQGRWNDIARDASRLASIWIDRLRRCAAGTLEILGRSRRVRVRELHARRDVSEIVVATCVRRGHASSRNKPSESYSFALHFGLVVEKKERLVFLNRPAQRTAELVQLELLLGRRDPKIESFCIESSVAEKLKQRTVKLVRSRFRGHQYCGPGALAVFGRVVVG